jgi:hypothetical protein
MRRISVKLILLLATVAASPCWGQPPTISSLQSSVSLGVPYDVTGITSGTALAGGGFFLFVNSTAGDFVPANLQNVTWLNTSTNTATQVFPPNGLVTTATQIIVFVPNALFATPVANPVSVTITVHETTRTSNSATFTINPPLQAVQPILPTGTLNQFYSANLTTGGTPPFSEGGVAGGNPPPGLTAPNPTVTISGTPTQTGVFNFQTAFADFWGNVAGGTDTIEIVDVPTLTSLLPNTSGTGAGDLTMTVTGTNFVGPVQVGQFQIPGSQVQWTAGGVTTPLATTYINTQLAAFIPSALLATAGVASVTVVQPGNATSNALPFSVLAPSISTILPVSVPAGSSATVLTVNGANFVVNAALSAVSTVTLNGVALVTTFISSGTLTAAVPAGMLISPIQYSVQVTNPGGTVSGALTFSVLGPGIASLSTTSLPAGSPAFVLTVTGANYLPGSQISFGGTALATTFVNGTTLTATVPANLLIAAGQVNVQVNNPGGANSNTALFNVLAPVIGSLLPASVLAGVPAFTLAVTGANFIAGSQVSFDASPLTTSFVSATLLNATVPAAMVAGPKVASIVVTNPGIGASVSAPAPFTVVNSLAITTTSLPPGTLGGSYTYTLTGKGGTPPYTWSAGGYPLALSVSPGTGVISGVIQAGGTFVITVVLRDAAQTTATAQFTLVVGPPPVTIAPSSSMPSGVVGVIYQGFVFAYGGTGSYTYSLGGGSLPDGLTLSSNGTVYGTPKTPGRFNFSVVATDSAGASASANFSVTIQPAPLNITGGPTGPVAAGTPISITFTGAGGVGPYRVSLSGSLPPGTAFNNGVLSGTPTTPGAFTFHVTITDSTGLVFSGDFTLTVTPAALSLGGTLSGGKVGVPYTGQISATGGVSPYSYAGAGLPGGLSLSAAGAISGTPTTAGQFTLTATVTDAKGATAAGKFAITIAPADLSIVTAALPDGVVGVAYSAGLSSSGGTGPYSWTVTGLPPGLTATAAGAISGTPTTAGKFTVSATVKDTGPPPPLGAPNAPAVVTKSFTITIAAAALAITTASAPNGTVGTAYAASFAASGGIAPYTFSASGLPAGMSMSAAGAISGTPTAPGAATIVVTVKDSSGASTSQSFAVTIGLPPTPPLSFNIAGISDTANPLQQPRLQVTLGSGYPVDVVVSLTLTFVPDSGGDDPTIQFSSGGRTARVTVPAGATAGSTDVGVQTGTVAGLIAITAQLQASGQDVTPSPAPRRTIRIAAAAPVIVPGTLTAVRNSTGFTVTLTGYVTDRELTQAIFVFTASAGSNLQTTTLTVPLDAMFVTYFGGSSATPFGSQFTYTQPFTVNGSTQAIASVTVTLVNRIGQSTPVTATLN